MTAPYLPSRERERTQRHKIGMESFSTWTLSLLSFSSLTPPEQPEYTSDKATRSVLIRAAYLKVGFWLFGQKRQEGLTGQRGTSPRIQPDINRCASSFATALFVLWSARNTCGPFRSEFRGGGNKRESIGGLIIRARWKSEKAVGARGPGTKRPARRYWPLKEHTSAPATRSRRIKHREQQEKNAAETRAIKIQPARIKLLFVGGRSR